MPDMVKLPEVMRSGFVGLILDKQQTPGTNMNQPFLFCQQRAFHFCGRRSFSLDSLSMYPTADPVGYDSEELLRI